jgi:hypothetical protein
MITLIQQLSFPFDSHANLLIRRMSFISPFWLFNPVRARFEVYHFSTGNAREKIVAFSVLKMRRRVAFFPRETHECQKFEPAAHRFPGLTACCIIALDKSAAFMTFRGRCSPFQARMKAYKGLLSSVYASHRHTRTVCLKKSSLWRWGSRRRSPPCMRQTGSRTGAYRLHAQAK